MRLSSRKDLELVIDRARRLASSPLGQEPPALDARWTPPGAPTLTSPDQLKLDAALRIARQFLDPAEPIAFAALGERLAPDPDLSDRFRRDLAKVSRELPASLDQTPPMRFKIKGQVAPTHREILDAFLYGNLDRIAEARREPVIGWLSQPAGALLVRSQLLTALGILRKAIHELRATCERELLRAAG